jgi:tetratricopeptide (TPR) repeat protein
VVPEDVLQAQTCAAWKHWVLSEPDLAVPALPQDISAAVQNLTGIGKTTSAWTDICLIKAAYIKGTAQSQTGNASDALQTFKPFVPWIDNIKARLSGQTQLSYWSEQMLAQMAFVASTNLDLFAMHSDTRIGIALQAFRLWADLSTRSKEISHTTFGNSQVHLSNLHILKGYYDLVSRLLQHDFSYPRTDEVRPRSRQATELRNVERMYENELLRRSRFPKAQESNAPIEDWVEQVIGNWELLCGPNWREVDLGEGGCNAVGRNVLDILYRAATKTFHSTLILRRLFQVHKSLTDFDLAYKALDTYIELIERGKARAAKSHETPVGQDGDEIVLRTVSEGIEGLCSFGFRDEAEKAYELAVKVEVWLQDQLPSPTVELAVNGHTEETTNESPVKQQPVSPETMEIVHRAIGIGQAYWARWTPISESRTSLQAQAVSNLKRAVGKDGGNKHHLESIYALSLLLAETRDISKAIEYVKKALTWDRPPADQDLTFSIERKLIPLWHLLALLLTARQDFETADQICGAAFEQFPSPRVLFGSGRGQNSHYLSAEKQVPYNNEEPGLVDDMETGELERIIEIRVTELALIEVSEGPEEAVNMTNELLSLFSRLFGRLDVVKGDKPVQTSLDPPKSSASTVKSFRGSIFGRKKQARPALQDMEKANGISTIPEKEPPRQPTRASNAPTIEVTDEHDKRHHIRLGHSRHLKHSSPENSNAQKLHRRQGSITGLIRRHSKDRRTNRAHNHDSSQRQSFETSPEIPEQARSGDLGEASNSADHGLPRRSVDIASSHPPATPVAPAQLHDSSPTARNTLQPVGHNKPHNELPAPPGHDSKTPEQDVRLPIVNAQTSSTQPLPRFPKSAAQKHGLVILVRIWLLIAGLYRRAMMFDDSREACDEADRAAMRIESLVAAQESSARAFASPSWGSGKSSDEVWADVLCERAALASAKGETKEAVEQYEQALLFWPDHTKATVGLSNILLDIFEQKGTKEEVSDISPKTAGRTKKGRKSSETMNGSQNGTLVETGPLATSSHAGEELRKTPENLNRLAARDRAYGLLSNLTKLGTAWDDSEAWFALARASELSGQVEKSKEVLWWCVELEDRRPLRSWRSITAGSYIL